jgi:hypothetical protein
MLQNGLCWRGGDRDAMSFVFDLGTIFPKASNDRKWLNYLWLSLPNRLSWYSPILHTVKGFFVGNVIHQYEAHSTTVVGCCDSAVPFLSSSVLGKKCTYAISLWRCGTQVCTFLVYFYILLPHNNHLKNVHDVEAESSLT